MDASVVDLRSDTVTRPTPAMRRAMAEAEVGDDVYGEDPTVRRLEERAAELFNKPAALFVPSGSMGNLIAIWLWAGAGREVICEEQAHINQYELASMSALAGAFPRPLAEPQGWLSWPRVERAIRPRIYYLSQTGLISLENTHNMAGGIVYPQAEFDAVCDGAHAAGLPVHLDGARIFNAAVSTGLPVARLTEKADSVMFCLSKGLGAPVGSMLLGPEGFIREARIVRKTLGGGMRQAGVLAAAGLVALEESPPRLAEDHQKARRLAEELAEIPGICLDLRRVQTNIVIFRITRPDLTATEFCDRLRTRGVLAGAVGPDTVRMVTHYDVSLTGIEKAVQAVRAVLAGA
jgi:threonine aldolase